MIRISKFTTILTNSHLLATAEKAQKKTELKKEKERNRVNNYGWNIFSDVIAVSVSDLQEAIYRGYEKRLKNLPTNPDIVKESEEMYSDLLDYGMKSRLSDDVINRVVDDQKKQDDKHAQFSKRRKLYLLYNLIILSYNQEEVDYINERNRVYNRKLDRYYNRFTSDIRANLERGSAL